VLSGGVHRGCVKRARGARREVGNVEGFGDWVRQKGGRGVGGAAERQKRKKWRRGADTGRGEADAAADEARERETRRGGGQRRHAPPSSYTTKGGGRVQFFKNKKVVLA
jgi:hypothetical protein